MAVRAAQVVLVVGALLLSGGAIGEYLRRLAPPGPQVRATTRDPVYWGSSSWTTVATRTAPGTITDADAARGTAMPPDADATITYVLNPNAGPWPLTWLMGEESLSIQLMMQYNHQAPPNEPTEESLRRLLILLGDRVLDDPAVVRTGLSVTPDRPVRSWVNWPAAATFASISVGALTLATVGGLRAAQRLFFSRHRFIRRGLCPRCRYDLSGLDRPHCPECGNGLSLHERAIVSQLRR